MLANALETLSVEQCKTTDRCMLPYTEAGGRRRSSPSLCLAPGPAGVRTEFMYEGVLGKVSLIPNSAPFAMVEWHYRRVVECRRLDALSSNPFSPPRTIVDMSIRVGPELLTHRTNNPRVGM